MSTRIKLFVRLDTMTEPLESEDELQAAPGTPEFAAEAAELLQDFVSAFVESCASQPQAPENAR